MFIDSHAHIDGEEFDADRDEVVARARSAGVRAILNVGTGDPHGGALERAVAVAECYEGVYAAVGVHPHDAKLYDERAEHRLLDIIGRGGRVVAWGEIGLDFHYDHSPRDTQLRIFARQLRLAREADVPVIIHSREADDETARVLCEEYAGAPRGGVMHCFGGGPARGGATRRRDALLRRRAGAGRGGALPRLLYLLRRQRDLQEGRAAARGRPPSAARSPPR